jgi:hypothetical protein
VIDFFVSLFKQMAGNSPVWMLIAVLLSVIGFAGIFLFRAGYNYINKMNETHAAQIQQALNRADLMLVEQRADSLRREEHLLEDSRKREEVLMNELSKISNNQSTLTALYERFSDELRDIRNVVMGK